MATPKTPRKRAADQTSATKADIAETAIPDAEVVLGQPEPEKPVLETSSPKMAAPESSTLESSTPEKPKSEMPTPEAPATEMAAPKQVKPAPEMPPTKDIPNQAPPQTPPPAPKSGFVPMVFGGVVAAGLGFALAQFVAPNGWPTSGAPLPDTQPSEAQQALQVQLAQQADQIATLQAQLQALPPPPDTTDLRDELADLRAASTAAQAAAPDLTDLNSRLAALEQRPTAAASINPAAIDTLTNDIATLRQGLDAQKSAADALIASAEIARQQAAAEAQTVLLQAALNNVKAAMQNGLPFAEPLALLIDASLTITAPLMDTAETGLPTTAALAASFDQPARAALEISLRNNMGDTTSERAWSFLRAQTGARSLTPQEGSDPDAVLSRADAAVVAGDFATALTEISTLPEPAQAALADWVAQVNLRNDAQSATAELAAALSER